MNELNRNSFDNESSLAAKDSSLDSISNLGSTPASTSSIAELPLSPNLMRNLGDRSYDKRKSAAMEVENLVKLLYDQGNVDRISSIIDMLGQDFASSTNANHRKGGLIGLAAITIGLMGKAHVYLDRLLPPVLHCFDDPESRVRYYACESLYNISKVARGDILQYFNQIFDGLCKLFADVDVDVKNGANLLDRLVKDIVTESESFDVDIFIPMLQKYIQMSNPYIRQLLVGWITVLDSVPDIDMLDYLPEFLDGLFNMLSDGNREIRQAADSALAEFLREIKQTETVEYGSMVHILVGQCNNSNERFNRLTAVTWIHEFVILGGKKLSLFYAGLLEAIMRCISDSEHEIRQVAEKANADLLDLVQATEEGVNINTVMDKLEIELENDHVSTRMASLKWISMLLDKSPDQLQGHVNSLLPRLLEILSDASDAVVLLDLEVLARISKNKKEFHRVLNDIVELFYIDRRLLENRGSLIIRKFCVLLDPKSIYLILANVISNSKDFEFASLMVQTLNLILLTASELEDLRKLLQRSFDKTATESDVQVFKSLFQTWCHSPIATFSFCLLAQAYELSSQLITKFADINVTVGFLMQIDNLVQLLESPVFIYLRLQLLETEKEFHAPLMKSLYGLLMLLPQSTAFKTLRDRLASVTSMTSAISFGQQHRCNASVDKISQNESNVLIKELDSFLESFTLIQEKHYEGKRKIIEERNLLMPSGQGD